MDKGVKFDNDKIRYDLIPPEAMQALAIILQKGAAKYEERNWEKGMQWSRVFRAAMGHLWDWWFRRGNDHETGRSHLEHALCCVAFLVTYERRRTGEDNRPVTPLSVDTFHVQRESTGPQGDPNRERK